MLKKYAILLVLILGLSGCGKINTPIENTTPTTDETVSWKTYSSQKFGFSIDIPEKVLSDYADDKSWAPLNIFEDDNSAYFTTRSKEETLENNSWDLKIGGATINSKDKITPFLESYYNVKGCETELNRDQDSEFFNIQIFAKNQNLTPDDPMSCFIGGKVKTIYDETSGRLITYQLYEPFFFVPGGNVHEESIASLRLEP